MIYTYIVGNQFMEKEFATFEQAVESITRLHAVPHVEKIMWVLSERKLTEKEATMLNVVQQEF